ncbi:MAG: glycosyltransferase family 4 protein [Lachnospiraceae bacterium]|nr:glycosyltransferase family 4 protein [Lachnospiraceae bacterium]
MVRVCFFSGDITRNGGTERVSATIANALAKDPDYEVSFLSLVEQKESPFYELDPKIRRSALGTKWLSPGPAYLPLIPKVRKYLKSHKIDVIIDIDIVLDVLSVPAAKGLHTKVISWEHSNCQFELTQGWYRRIILNLFTKKTDLIVTLTPGDAKAFQAHFGRKERITSIFNPAAVEPATEELPRENWIVTASRLVPEKGFDLLMQVAKEVLPKYLNWKWVLCGDGPERESLERFREEEHLTEQFVLMGYVPKVEDILRKSKVFVLTSRAEGLPMCLLEARACNVPCVSFDVPTGPADIIDEGKNGFLIKPFDCEDMATKLFMLMADEELQYQMARSAGEDLEKFSLASITAQWKESIGELLRS